MRSKITKKRQNSALISESLLYPKLLQADFANVKYITKTRGIEKRLLKAYRSFIRSSYKRIRLYQIRNQHYKLSRFIYVVDNSAKNIFF